jgi:hypothetical protein
LRFAPDLCTTVKLNDASPGVCGAPVAAGHGHGHG